MADPALIKKLGIKSGQRLLVMNAPAGYREALGKQAEGVELESTAGGVFDFVQLFVGNKAEIDSLAPQALAALKPGGRLWFSYPKKSSNVETDVSRDVGWEALASAGMRPVTQVSIDDTWSALRFRPVSEVKSRKTE